MHGLTNLKICGYMLVDCLGTLLSGLQGKCGPRYCTMNKSV